MRTTFEEKTDVNAEEDGGILLHSFASSGYLDLVKYLIDEEGADVNAKNNNDKTPLDYAETEEIKEAIRNANKL